MATQWKLRCLSFGDKAGLSKAKLLLDYPELKEEAFDPDIKMMASYHQLGEKIHVAVKGAPEAVIANCKEVFK